MAEKIQIKKKEFNYRGKPLDELKQLNIREFAKLLKSRERRTVLRQSNEIDKFLLKCEQNSKKNKPIKTHSRYLVIVPKMVGLRIGVHSGKDFVFIEITSDMLGHRLGEFSVTRTKVKHGAAGVGATRGSASLSVK